MVRKKRSTESPYLPQVGELVKDVMADKEVVYMDTRGGLAYVRPVGGGIEWTVDPAALQPLPDGPTLAFVVIPAKSRIGGIE
ncbi:hypothetical protein [Streptomyces sp. NRRL WC-3742]|uniref:hypothetical protein n=1 Tax=Streptomyces sp. NRRL WC-3742 TaxID=1463934 RepID=UPI0004CB0466|nr:hypothetical protein [Streptomyces sp. NRRL WC-3742]